MEEKLTWFLRKAVEWAEARRREVRGLQVILVTRFGWEERVASEARRLGFRVLGVVPGSVLVDVPGPEYLDQLARIPGVESIAYNAPVQPMEVLLGELATLANVAGDPLLSKLEPSELERLGLKVKILPWQVREAIATPPPIGLVKSILKPDYIVIPTSRSRLLLEVPSGAKVKVRVAVIDSGVSPNPALRKFVRQVVLTLEPPGDYMSHGLWCHSAAFGSPWGLTRFGPLEPVVDAEDSIHYKVFTAVGGASTFQVMKAMYFAAMNGAKVVSMSLGGPLQDRVDRQPDARLACQLSREYGTIYVVAAGNDGPDLYTIASPGASPCAITVASYSITDGDAAWWSSRGPQGGYYKEHRDIFEEDYAKYGDAFLKPTVAAPGGGRKYRNARPDEVIYSGCTGWFEALAPYDHTPLDGFCGMHGTSQATPHMAGLVAFLVDRGVVRGWRDVFGAVRRAAAGHSNTLGWGLARLGLWRGVW